MSTLAGFSVQKVDDDRVKETVALLKEYASHPAPRDTCRFMGMLFHMYKEGHFVVEKRLNLCAKEMRIAMKEVFVSEIERVENRLRAMGQSLQEEPFRSTCNSLLARLDSIDRADEVSWFARLHPQGVPEAHFTSRSCAAVIFLDGGLDEDLDTATLGWTGIARPQIITA